MLYILLIDHIQSLDKLNRRHDVVFMFAHHHLLLCMHNSLHHLVSFIIHLVT